MARNRQHETLIEEIILATEHNFDEKAYLLSKSGRRCWGQTRHIFDRTRALH